MDPAHARASPSKNDGKDSEEHHHHAEQGYDSCASCRAAGKKPFQGHAEREEGCTCVMGEGAVPTGFHEGNAGKGGSQHGMSFFLSLFLSLFLALVPGCTREVSGWLTGDR